MGWKLSDWLVYAMLGLMVVILIGMLTGSWRVVLYPFLLVIGISIILGFVRQIAGGRSAVALASAGGVVALFFVLFVWVDLLSGGEPTGSTAYILGMTPVTALYVIGVPLLVALPGLLYALTFTREDVDPALSDGPAADREEG